MSDKISMSTADAATAIDEVLVAETVARQAMEACQKEAEEILEAAREDAREITRIATQRITRIHARCDQLVNSRVAQIRAAAREAAVRTELNAADRTLLTKAVDRLAARLTRSGNG